MLNILVSRHTYISSQHIHEERYIHVAMGLRARSRTQPGVVRQQLILSWLLGFACIIGRFGTGCQENVACWLFGRSCASLWKGVSR